MEQAGTIAAVLSGFITAFAAEPIKNLIQDLTERHRLRKVLYAEVSNMYEAWNGFLQLLSNPELKLDWAAAAKVNTRADCSVYIKKSDPILFYNLKNAGKLEIAYRNFFTAQEQITLNGREALPYVYEACGYTKDLLRKEKIPFTWISPINSRHSSSAIG